MDVIFGLLVAYLVLVGLVVLFTVYGAVVYNDRSYFIVISVLNVLLMGGVSFFVLYDTTERLRGLEEEGTPRVVFWLGAMAAFLAIVVLAGTLVLQLTNLTSFHRLEEDAQELKETRDFLTTIFLLPTVVVGYLGVVACVIFRASSAGGLRAKGGLDFEAWATLLIAGGLWCLLQSAAVAIVRQGLRFGVGAFATATLFAVMPFVSDAFDSAKDICFAALALQHADPTMQAIGWVSGSLVVIVHIFMLATQGGRFELRNTYLGVFLVACESGNVAGRSCKESTLDKLGLALVKQSTPERVWCLILEDAPQGILALCFSLASSTFSPWIIGINIVVPILRVCAAKLLYSRFLSWGFVIDALLQPLSKDIPAANRAWTLDQLGNAMKLRGEFGALLWIQSRIQAQVETGTDKFSAFFDLLALIRPSAKVHFRDDVREIEMSGEYLRLAEVGMVAWFLEANDTLQNLDLNGARIDDQGAAALAKALEANATLLQLNLSNNSIGVQGAAALAKGLEANATLQILGLGGNQIGGQGAAAVAKALEANATLQNLRLESNKIGDQGAAAFAKALEANATLQELNLWDNNIGDQGAAALGKALEANATLQILYLGGNTIGDQGAAAFAKALEANATLKKLELGSDWAGFSRNNIGDQGAAALAKALEANASLQTLGLSRNNIGDEGASAFAELLKGAKCPKALRSLDLERNNISDTVEKALREASDAVRAQDREFNLEL